MAWYSAIFLGLVQGLAEFLPISSSGHLLLLADWLGIESSLLLTIVLHLATLLAVVVVYWRPLVQLVRRPFNRYNWQLVVATAITCALVLLLKKPLDRLFSVDYLPWALIATGVFLCLPAGRSGKQPNAGAWTWRATIAMGVAQGIAVVPGLSRSGLTITSGRLVGATTSDAADFSFIMSIPIIVASLVYEIAHGGQLGAVSWPQLALAFGSAFLAGIVAIKWLLGLARKVDFRWFAVYLWLLGGTLLLYRGFQVFQ